MLPAGRSITYLCVCSVINLPVQINLKSLHVYAMSLSHSPLALFPFLFSPLVIEKNCSVHVIFSLCVLMLAVETLLTAGG